MPHQASDNTAQSEGDGQEVAVSLPVTEPVTHTTWLSLSFLLSMLDPREFIFPCTARKIKIWSLYLLLAGLFSFLEIQFDLSAQFAEAIVNSNELWLLIFLYGYEPALMLMNLMFVNYPDKFPYVRIDTLEHAAVNQLSPLPIERPLSFVQQLYNNQSAIIIPSHKNAGFIRETIKACLKIVHSAEQILVVDNGNSDTPLDDTLRVVKEFNPLVRYIWVNQPNKTIAQYVGLQIMREKYPTVLIIDDDVLLPEDFVMPIAFLRQGVDGFCIPIRAIDGNGKRPFFIAWQDIEYKKSGFWNALADRSSSVVAPHGAISFWRSEVLSNILRHHNLVFYGEDAKIGLIAQHCDYNLRLYPYFPVNTVAPSTVLGEAPNWWGQRVRAWEMIRHARLFSFIRHFLTTSKDTVSGTLMLKLSQFNMIYANLADLLRLPVMLILGSRPSFWIRFGIFQTCDVIFMHLWNEEKLRYRPKEKSTKLSIWTYWIYKQLLQFIAIPSLLRALFIYLPNAKTWKRIPELEASGELNIQNILDHAKQLAEQQGFVEAPETLSEPLESTVSNKRPQDDRLLVEHANEKELRAWRLHRFEDSLQSPVVAALASSNATSLSYSESRDTGSYHTKTIPHRQAEGGSALPPPTYPHRAQKPPAHLRGSRKMEPPPAPPKRGSDLLTAMSEYSDDTVEERPARAIVPQHEAQRKRECEAREERGGHNSSAYPDRNKGKAQQQSRL